MKLGIPIIHIELVKEHINKLLSGRFYLTIVGGVVFAYAVWKGKIDNQATTAILTAIFMSYFNRSDRNNGKGGEIK